MPLHVDSLPDGFGSLAIETNLIFWLARPGNHELTLLYPIQNLEPYALTYHAFFGESI